MLFFILDLIKLKFHKPSQKCYHFPQVRRIKHAKMIYIYSHITKIARKTVSKINAASISNIFKNTCFPFKRNFFYFFQKLRNNWTAFSKKGVKNKFQRVNPCFQNYLRPYFPPFR